MFGNLFKKTICPKCASENGGHLPMDGRFQMCNRCAIGYDYVVFKDTSKGERFTRVFIVIAAKKKVGY